jgi:hypothetical protein
MIFVVNFKLTNFVDTKNMWYEDLTKCDYFADERLNVMTAVGWLEKYKKFPSGKTKKKIYKKLCKLVVEAELWGTSHYMGYHECNICQFQGFSNNGELCIPYKNRIYVSPLSIVHYINAHNYKPPEEFYEAVKQCPPISSSRYQQKMIESDGEYIFSIMSNNHQKVLKWIKTGEVSYFNMKSYESYNRTN